MWRCSGLRSLAGPHRWISRRGGTERTDRVHMGLNPSQREPSASLRVRVSDPSGANASGADEDALDKHGFIREGEGVQPQDHARTQDRLL